MVNVGVDIHSSPFVSRFNLKQDNSLCKLASFLFRPLLSSFGCSTFRCGLKLDAAFEFAVSDWIKLHKRNCSYQFYYQQGADFS
jgi:hypothetical protein